MENTSERTIHISPGSVFKSALVLVGLYVLFLLRDIALIVLTAVVIASAVEPATGWFKKYKVGRLPAVIIVYLLIAIFLFGIFYLALPPILSEMTSFLNTVPNYLSTLDFESLSSFDFQHGGQTIENITNVLNIKDVVSGLRAYLSDIPGATFSTVSTVFGGALSFVLILVLSFYLAVQEDGIEKFLRVIVPYKHQRYATDLWKRTQRRIGLWMQGQLLLMLIIGVLVYLGLTIMQVEHAFLFAILAALFELIPLFGPVLASIPAIIIGFAQGGPSLGLVVIGLYIIIQQFENHLIYPLVVHKVVGVSPLLVILALIIGAELAGFLGILLSVPVATALMEFTNDIQRHNKRLAEIEQGT
jgi:predicted PurR-regulated permease PerM